MSRDENDRLVDDALATYCPEPRPGIEARVMAQVRAESRKRPPVAWPMVVWRMMAIAAAAGCLFLFVIARRPRSEIGIPTPPRQVASSVARVTGPPIPKVVTAAHRKTRRRALRLPRAEQFPIAAPLTEEERLLLGFVKQSPDKAIELLALAKPNEIEPIAIREIKIQPLASDGQ
jgi:hypothetical protein